VTLVDPELAARVLERALARGGDMAELYAESRRGFAISLDDGRVERPQGGRERGACVRVVRGDSTYYGHVDGLAEDDLLRVAGSVSQAVRGEASRPAALRALESGTRHEVATPPEEVAAARKADLLRACDERARAAGP
jgi:TldD protein